MFKEIFLISLLKKYADSSVNNSFTSFTISNSQAFYNLHWVPLNLLKRSACSDVKFDMLSSFKIFGNLLSVPAVPHRVKWLQPQLLSSLPIPIPQAVFCFSVRRREGGGIT